MKPGFHYPEQAWDLGRMPFAERADVTGDANVTGDADKCVGPVTGSGKIYRTRA